MKITVLTIKNESGDDYDPILFDNKPTEKQLEKFLRIKFEEEFTEDNSGPGEFGSYLHVNITETEIIKLKQSEKE